MFDNALIYRAHSHFPGADQLAQLCQKQLFRACAATEAKRVGWSTVCGDQMVHSVNSQFLVLRFSRQERLLPAAAVKEEVEERAAAREKASGSPLRRAEKQILKEEVYEELLPRALKRTGHFLVAIDTQRGWILVDAASRKKAEEALDLLRLSTGSLKVTPLATRDRATDLMTRWLANPAERAEGWELGEACQLESPSGDEGVIKATEVDLESDEIQQHLEGGRICSALAVARTDQLALVLQDDLALKKIKFDEALIEGADPSDDDASAFDTEAHLHIPALAAVIEELIGLLGGEVSPVIDEEASTEEQEAA
ncbi:Recombination associated protein (modular protein) [Halomonas sp. A3H3]|uniref:recombination-associated protein RdgC n=1 Tax=Halomonas sp. A3H3 TaxID=1346287 RepID=UPI00038D01E7|nr:recombination-associated protein RdgC [Halomonas sp. A3H3]CDG56189.1 Recombination associated protein (modular protein) [Halomonas sp. A3H3]